MSGSMMGGVDAGIALHAGQGVTPLQNPLTQYGDFVHLQSAVNQNALFPGQQQLQQQAITHGDQATQSNQLTLSTQNRNAVYAHLAPLIAVKDPSMDLVNQALGTAAANGFNVNPTLDRLHATFPVAGTPGDTPEGRRAWLQGLVGATLAPSEQVAAATPSFGGFVSDGGQQIPYSVGAKLGPNAGMPLGAGAPIQLTTSPSENANLVRVSDPKHPGAFLLQPRSALPGADGKPPQAAPIPTPDGVAPGAYRPRATPGATATPPGAVQDTADPNVLEKNKADVEAYNTAQKGVQASVGDTQTLGHALEALKILHDATLSTGPGTDTMHKMYAYLQTVGGLPPGMTDNVANWELAKKALTAFAASQGNQAHTDMGLATAAASNASVDGVTNQAAQTVVKQKLGQIRQSVAQVNEHADNTGVGYNEHASKFIQNTDPRAFAFDEYTPQERAQIIDTLGKPGSAAYNRFNESLRIARRNKFISPPGQ